MTGAAVERASRPGGPEADGRGAWPFVAVWLPSVVVIIGSGACLFSLSWWLSQSARGGADLGLVVGGSSVISLTTVALVSGRLDRADRRTATIGLLLLLAAPIALLLVVLGPAHDLTTVLLAALCYVAVSTGESLYLATTETTAIDLAPGSWAPSRTALLTQIHSQVERVVAPSAAGALLAGGEIRAVPLAALVLVLAMLAVAFCARRPLDTATARARAEAAAAGPAAAGDGIWQSARAALGLVRDHRDLVFLIQLGVLGNLVVFPFYAVLPAFLGDYAGGPADVALWYGRAATAYGLGMLAGSALLVRGRKDVGGDRALGLAASCLGLICLILLAATLTTRPWAVVGAMAVTGALFSVLVAVGGAVWLRRTPAPVRARVFSLRRLTVYSSIPFGTALMGLGGAAIGSRPFVRLIVLSVLVLLGAAWLRHRTTQNAHLAEKGSPS
ncbi:hypothetical protein [Streptomyces sp. NPDC019224]|uniref:hypothetical protein n=1 Tax=Streptomyces sp. NPDC019224 TaxID=3154484 RepID=UPI0034048AC7